MLRKVLKQYIYIKRQTSNNFFLPFRKKKEKNEKFPIKIKIHNILL